MMIVWMVVVVAVEIEVIVGKIKLVIIEIARILII